MACSMNSVSVPSPPKLAFVCDDRVCDSNMLIAMGVVYWELITMLNSYLQGNASQQY